MRTMVILHKHCFCDILREAQNRIAIREIRAKTMPAMSTCQARRAQTSAINPHADFLRFRPIGRNFRALCAEKQKKRA